MTDSENSGRLFARFETIAHGPWQVTLRGDEVANILHHGNPVLRAIRAVVRDHNWRTLVPSVTATAARTTDDAAELTLELDFQGAGARYDGELVLRLGANSLDVDFHGRAPLDFASNRIGLVVLHRPDDAGRPLTITSPDGTRQQKQFPVAISPHQPFTDIAGMEWVRDGARYRLDFAGDTFETEDQRNWTDASFKTYSTPLARPFPVAVTAGDQVHQRIRLSATSDAGRAGHRGEPAGAREAVVVGDRAVAVVPGLGTTTTGTAAVLAPVPGLDALLVELDARDGQSAVERRIGRARQQAAALGTSLDVRLTVTDAAQISGLLDAVPPGEVVRLGAFDSSTHITEPALWSRLHSEAAAHGFAGTLVAGARSHFTELNRTSDRLPDSADAVTYSITPQMHATEVPHIVESLPMQRLTAMEALRIGSGRPLHLGPVTLKARFNAVATHDDGETETGTTDELQAESFTAAWLLGSIAALTMPGVESISYFELDGPRGLITDAGQETPAATILAQVAALRGQDVLAVTGEVPGLVLYPVRHSGRLTLFAANLTPDTLTADVGWGHGNTATFELRPWTTSVRHLN